MLTFSNFSPKPSLNVLQIHCCPSSPLKLPPQRYPVTSNKFSVLISLALPACELLAHHPYSLKHFILASRGFYHLSFPPTSLTLSFTSSLLMLPHCSRAQFLDLFSFLPSLTSLVISFSLMAVNNKSQADNSYFHLFSLDLSPELQTHMPNCLLLGLSNRHLKLKCVQNSVPDLPPKPVLPAVLSVSVNGNSILLDRILGDFQLSVMSRRKNGRNETDKRQD